MEKRTGQPSNGELRIRYFALTPGPAATAPDQERRQADAAPGPAYCAATDAARVSITRSAKRPVSSERWSNSAV